MNEQTQGAQAQAKHRRGLAKRLDEIDAKLDQLREALVDRSRPDAIRRPPIYPAVKNSE